MVETVPANQISLYDLETKFGLTEVKDDLFLVYLNELPDPQVKQSLERIQRNYSNLSKRRPMLEDLVKMVVLSPLLDLAEFYHPDFEFRTEAKVEILIEDEETIKGYIDILILKKNVWALVIESKRTQIDVVSALPQCLVYLLNSPNLVHATFGLVTNGREFVFIKLIQNNPPQYARSDALTIEREQEFYSVFKMLKHLKEIEVEN